MVDRYKPVHAELDAKIIRAIKDGCLHFWSIKNRFPDVGFRLIDRRLQFLRKKGIIYYRGPTEGWSIA